MSDQIPDAERLRLEQREFWNRAAPGWNQLWSVLDRAAQHVSDRLVELARIGPGGRVLDIATGSGEPGITAARKVGPGGLVVATDLSPAMLDLARQRAAALRLGNIKFVETGAESLAVEERDFDAVLCRWGLMFVPDLDAAARRIAQLLAAGARLATAVWGPPEKVPLISAGEDAIRELAKMPPLPPNAPHPLRLADPQPLLTALAAAGFNETLVQPVNVRFEFESAQAFVDQRQALSAPFRALLSRQTPEVQQQMLDAIRAAALAYADSSGVVRMDNQTLLLAAHLSS